MRTVEKVSYAVVLTAVVGLAALGTTAAAGDSSGSRIPLSAVFADASPLLPGNEVKASGVTVGEIIGVELQDGKAMVQMLVDRAVLPLHDDARAVITAKDVLGERFVTLERGAPGAPTMAQPLVIPVERTSAVVDIEDLVNALDDPTSAGFAGLLTTLGEGVRGRGPEVADTIRALAPAMEQTDQLGRLLTEQNQVLTALLDSVQPVAGEVAANRGQNFDAFLDSTERTLSAVAANRQATADALQRLPGTLQNAQDVLARTAGVAESGSASLGAIRPVTDDLSSIENELRRFSAAADPALASLRPVLDRAQELIDQARPVVDELRSSGSELRSVASSARDLSEKGLSLRFENLMQFAKFWALSTTGYDGLSHYFRASVPLTPAALGRDGAAMFPGAPDSPIPNLEYPEQQRFPLPGNCEGPDAPDNHPCAGEADTGGGGSDLPLRSGADTAPMPDGGATGLTAEQENSMLDQMLGGS